MPLGQFFGGGLFSKTIVNQSKNVTIFMLPHKYGGDQPNPFPTFFFSVWISQTQTLKHVCQQGLALINITCTPRVCHLLHELRGDFGRLIIDGPIDFLDDRPMFHVPKQQRYIEQKLFREQRTNEHIPACTVTPLSQAHLCCKRMVASLQNSSTDVLGSQCWLLQIQTTCLRLVFVSAALPPALHHPCSHRLVPYHRFSQHCWQIEHVGVVSQDALTNFRILVLVTSYSPTTAPFSIS